MAPFAEEIGSAFSLSSSDGSDFGTRTRCDGNGGYWLQLEGVISGGDESQRDGAIRGSVEILGFEPRAEPGVVDFRLPLPEVGFETALDAEMTELEFNVAIVFWEMAANIRSANMQSGDTVTFALSFYDHRVTCSGTSG